MGQFTERSGGEAAKVCDTTVNTARQGVLVHLSRDGGGLFRSGH